LSSPVRDDISVAQGETPGGDFLSLSRKRKKRRGSSAFFVWACDAASQAWCTGIGVGSSVMVTWLLMMSYTFSLIMESVM